MAYYQYTYQAPDVSMRLFIISFFRIPYFISASQALRSSEQFKELRGTKVLVMLLLAGATWYFFRGALALSSESWAIHLRTGSMQGVNFLVAAVLNVMITVSLFRIEAEQAIRQNNKTAADLRSSEFQYKSLFQNMLGGFAFHEIIYNGTLPADVRYIAVNSNFSALTGLSDVVGKGMAEVVPGILETDRDLFETYFRVARSGVSEKFEKYVKAMDQWFSFSVCCRL